MQFREKIDKLLEIKGIRLSKFAKVTDMGNTLEKAYQENRDMTDTLTQKFLHNASINPAWWDTGQGPEFLSKETNQMRVKTIDKAPAQDAAVVYEELYQKFLGKESEYLVIHRDILKDHRIIAVEQLEKEKQMAENAQREIADKMKHIEKLTDLNGKLSDMIGIAASRPINIQLTSPEKT